MRCGGLSRRHGHKRKTRQGGIGFPAHENNLVRSGIEIKYLWDNLVIVLTTGPAPAHSALLETRGDRHDIPDHGRVLRLAVDVDIKRIRVLAGRIHQRLNLIIPSIGNGEIVNRGSATANTHRRQRLIDIADGDPIDCGAGFQQTVHRGIRRADGNSPICRRPAGIWHRFHCKVCLRFRPHKAIAHHQRPYVAISHRVRIKITADIGDRACAVCVNHRRPSINGVAPLPVCALVAVTDNCTVVPG